MPESRIMLVCPSCKTSNRVPPERLADHPVCGKCKQALLTGRPIELDSAGLDVFLNKDELPILVDFWAAWCGPCRQMAPSFSKAAAAAGPGVRFAKLDTEAWPDQASRHQIRSLPTLALFVSGKEVERRMGVMSEQQILGWLQALV